MNQTSNIQREREKINKTGRQFDKQSTSFYTFDRRYAHIWSDSLQVKCCLRNKIDIIERICYSCNLYQFLFLLFSNCHIIGCVILLRVMSRKYLLRLKNWSIVEMRLQLRLALSHSNYLHRWIDPSYPNAVVMYLTFPFFAYFFKSHLFLLINKQHFRAPNNWYSYLEILFFSFCFVPLFCLIKFQRSTQGQLNIVNVARGTLFQLVMCDRLWLFEWNIKISHMWLCVCWSVPVTENTMRFLMPRRRLDTMSSPLLLLLVCFGFVPNWNNKKSHCWMLSLILTLIECNNLTYKYQYVIVTLTPGEFEIFFYFDFFFFPFFCSRQF